MTKNIRWLTALLLAGVLAMPAAAFAQHRQSSGGGNGGAARSFGGGHSVGGGGGGRSFGGGGGAHSFGRTGGGGRPAVFSSHGGRSISPHVGRSFSTHSGRSFTSHAGRSVQFQTGRHVTTSNRSVRHVQRQHIQHTQKRQAGSTIHRTQRNANIHRAQHNAKAQHNERHVVRRNGSPGVTPQAARHGRFGSHFAEHAGKHRWHAANIAARRAWRHGWRAGFVAWYGPVFWPYAYSDIFDYVFWPDGYDDGFWYYAYDDFFDGVFWGEDGPPAEYADAVPSSATVPRASRAGVEELCTQPGTGITAWPFAAIERKVGLNGEQKQLLGDVRKAAADAAATFKASCPPKYAFPLTPPGRLQAMTARLQGTLDAVKTVRPALEKFYAALSDEQKERFNELGPKSSANVAGGAAETTGATAQDSNSCKQPKPGLANLPIERVEDAVKPTGAQQDAMQALQEATTKAVSILQAACPQDVPLTPTGRLQAMEKRLQAMIEAANTVKPALDDFYTKLSNEQKARFNHLGRELAQNN